MICELLPWDLRFDPLSRDRCFEGILAVTSEAADLWNGRNVAARKQASFGSIATNILLAGSVRCLS